MEPITDIREISRIAYGFIASLALFAALDLDLFTRLSGEPKTLPALSQETRVSELRAQRLARRREWRGARYDAELYQTEKTVPPIEARRPSEVEVTPGA